MAENLTVHVYIHADIKDQFKKYLKEKKLNAGLVINQALREYLNEGGYL